MFLKFLMLAIAFAVVLFIFDILLPRLKTEYKIHKAIKLRKKRQEEFKNKMKELEID